MSSTVQILLKDDLDGSVANETMQFTFDGVSYEIDLSKRNAAALRQMMNRYIKAARRLRASGSATRTASANGARLRATAVAARRQPTTGKKNRPVVTGARRRGATASARVRKASGAGFNPAAVREWARKQGVPVSQRGRISSDVVAMFELARKG